MCDVSQYLQLATSSRSMSKAQKSPDITGFFTAEHDGLLILG